MIIRPACREDVPAIIAIYRLDPLTGHREPALDPFPDLYFTAFDALAADPNQVLLVAEENAQVIGTLQISYIQHLIDQALRRAVLEAIFIHPARQGEGVGAALVRAAADLATQAHCRALELTSNKSRQRAHGFYRRLGFQPSHEGFKLPLSKPDPAISDVSP
jgi:GNAT superfamily N-acetyltransferase